MIEVFGHLFPILAIIACGCVAVNLKWLPNDFFMHLARLVLYFFLPVSLFSSVSTMELADLISWDYLAVYTFAGFATYIFIFLGLSLLKKPGDDQIPVLALGGTFSNSIYIGYPLLIALFEASAAKILILTVVVEIAVLLPMILVFIEINRFTKTETPSKDLRVVVKNIALNPVILSVILGGLFSGLGVKLPDLIFQPMSAIGSCTTVLALFVVGGSIVFITDDEKRWTQYTSQLNMGVVAGKLLLHPLIVAGFIILIGISDPSLRAGAILVAALPTFSSFPILASPYGLRIRASTVVVSSTILSFLTLSILFVVVGF